MEPITELRLVRGPVVYGYLRMPVPGPARRAALTMALRGYCDRHELILGGVFTDTSGDGTWTPGFTALIDAVLAAGGYGVIVPSPAHLGARHLAAQRSAAIKRNGGRLILIRGVLSGLSGQAR